MTASLTLCSWSQLRRPYTLQCCTPAQDNTLYWIDHLSSADDTSITDLLSLVTSEIWYGNKVILKTLGSLPPQLWIFGNLNIWQLNAPSPFVETLKLWKLENLMLAPHLGLCPGTWPACSPPRGSPRSGKSQKINMTDVSIGRRFSHFTLLNESSEMSSSLFLRHHMCDSMIPEGARQKLHSGLIPQSFFGQNDFPLRGRGGDPPIPLRKNSAKRTAIFGQKTQILALFDQFF